MPQMPKEQEPQSQPVTIDQLLAVVREMVQANTLSADAVREIATKATVDTYDRTSGKNWDEKLYPRISHFNPLGDKAHPRPELVGEVFWLGHLLQKDELTTAEIHAINAIEPGIYTTPQGDQWVVRDLQPGRERAKRKLLVVFPCSDDDARARLPQGEWGGGKTGVEQMCELMTGSRVAAVA